MEKNYGKEKYISLIKAWEQRAERICDEKYTDWHEKVEKHLESPVFKSRLARLLGVHDPMELPKLGTTNQLIAAVTGFSDASIEKLRYMPSDDRGLMFAFAFVLGFEYRLVTTNDGKLLVHCDNELKQYFDDADMRLPDYHILEDYIYICANMYYEECNPANITGIAESSHWLNCRKNCGISWMSICLSSTHFLPGLIFMNIMQPSIS